LQESTASNHRRPIEISDDESADEAFHADLQRALDISNAEASASRRPYDVAESSFLSERAELERARIERLKRMRKDASFDDGQDVLMQQLAKRPHISSVSAVEGNGNDHPIASSSRSSTSLSNPATDQLFWDGELRQIANRHANPRQDGKPTFRLTEILGKVCIFIRLESIMIQMLLHRNLICRLPSCPLMRL
jgi:tyrosyl-DNA phosphodiesterase-1